MYSALKNIIMSVSGECVAFGRHIDGVARTRHGLSHSLQRRPVALSKTLSCHRLITEHIEVPSGDDHIRFVAARIFRCFPLFGDDLLPLTDSSGLSDDVAAS